MNFLESIRVALTALRINVLRSILTMLGIIIGVAAVITMIAMGSGAQRQVDSEISSLGSNLLMIHTGSTRDRGVNMGASARQRLTYGDARAIKREISGVAASAANISGRTQVVFGNMNWATTAYGVDNDHLIAGNWIVAEGRAFRSAENRTGARVVLIGATVHEQLFAESSALGQTIRIGNVPFEVIGVLEEKGQSMRGADQDDVLMVPLETARSRLFGDRPGIARGVNMIMVSMEEDWMMTEAQAEIEELLKQRHRIRPGQDDAFRIRNLAEMAETAEAAFQVFNMLLASIASVSLVVGGIGIMNIMLVSVTERTREIGLRRAVGASPRDILVQFLIEAITLCVVGGALGVGLAVVIVVVTAGFTGWPVIVTPEVIALAVLFSGVIGVFFGWYPASKAAKQNPIESLRYE